MRNKLETTRKGKTHTIKLGEVTIDLVVNTNKDGRVLELFAKADGGHAAHAEDICIPASLALQYGCPVATLAKQLRWRNYEPHGNFGQPLSISDGIGKVLMEYVEEENV